MAAFALTGWISPLGDAFARISPNERRLLVVLAAMVGLGGFYYAWDFAFTAGRENREARETLESARETARRVSGAGAAEQIAEARDKVRDWSWRAGSVNVAQVMAQQDIVQIAAAAGLADGKVETSARVETVGEVTLAPMHVTGTFDWNALSGVMSGLAGTGKGFVVDRVQATGDDNPKLRIDLKVPLAAAGSDT